MKKTACLAILLLTIFSLGTLSAQRPQGPRPELTSIKVASDHSAFWLFVDDVIQNTQPVRSITVEMIPVGEHYLRVELDNDAHVTVGQLVDLNRNSNYYWIDNQRNMYGISLGYGLPRTDVVVRLSVANPSGRGKKPRNHEWGKQPQNNTVVVVENAAEPSLGYMSESDFSKTIKLIKSQSFDSDKLDVAKQTLADNKLSVEQIAKICKCFEFENTKLDFAKSAYHHCYEKDKYYFLVDVFEFSSSKSQLNDFISSQK